MNIAIIPARGGSKRLPGKNTKLLSGKPLMAWTIEAALQSGVFDHVYVSTDSEEIAMVSREFHAEVPFLRPAELSTDEASTNDVITYFVNRLEDEYQIKAETITILQPTSPLRTAKHIQEARELMKNKNAGAVVSVCKVDFPIQFCNKLGEDLSMEGFIKPENQRRSQDLESYYKLNGAIYMFGRKYLGKLANLYSKGTYAYVMEGRASIDIDTAEDFELCEFSIRKF